MYHNFSFWWNPKTRDVTVKVGPSDTRLMERVTKSLKVCLNKTLNLLYHFANNVVTVYYLPRIKKIG